MTEAPNSKPEPGTRAGCLGIVGGGTLVNETTACGTNTILLVLRSKITVIGWLASDDRSAIAF